NAFKDERGIYVDAFSVEERDGAFYFEGDEVTREWGKMGKSLKNAVSPDEMYEAYGADTLRLYEMAMGPLDASRPWETRDVVGMFRFLQRLWRTMVVEETGELRTLADSTDDETRRLLHRTIDVVRTEMEALRFNTAIAKLIELNNHVTKVINATNEIPREVAESIVLMVAPLVPHIAEELWSKLGNTKSLTYAEFPSADPALLVDDEVEMPVQVRGKVRTRVMVPANADEKAITDIVLSDERVIAALDGADPATLKKIIVVPGRMVNLVP
ncbi:MAG: class I tRNA ligase family protein, partial [Actinomycetota bacterium]